MELDALKVNFTHSNTVRDKRPYTIYEIEVRSSTHTWVVYKRYSAFHSLHQELSKTQGQNMYIRLPHLPPKRLTRSLAVEFVEKRKQELQDYLKDILSTPELLHCPTILSFLEVPDSIKPMLASRAPAGKGSGYPGIDMKDMSEKVRNHLMSNKIDYQHKTYEERKVLDTLTLLKHHHNRVAAIKSFEEYFFSVRPRLTNEFILILLYGGMGQEVEGGLIETCGDFAYSHVASRAALYLLCRLLDVEKNKDAHQYLEQFCCLPQSVLAKMNLQLHILSERGNRLGAFKIVQVLHNAHKEPSFIEDIVADAWARQEYFRWSERKLDSAFQYGKDSEDFVLKSVSLADVSYKKVAKEMFQDIYKVAKSEAEWKVVSSPSLASSPSSELSKVSIKYKKDVRKDMVVVCVSAVVPFEVDEVAELICDLNMREYWDTKYHEGHVVQGLDRNADVVHMVFKSFSSPYKYRDFCLLRSTTKLENGGRLLATRSVLHPQVPECKDNVRAVLYPTGYLISPMQPKAGDSESWSMMTYIGQMDREAVLIVSPDLLGENNELRQSFINIQTCLARKREGTLFNQGEQRPNRATIGTAFASSDAAAPAVTAPPEMGVGVAEAAASPTPA